jgi:hypothetical protein
MKQLSWAILLVLVSSVMPVWAQGPPTPAPELKKLDYFVGSWTADVDMKPGPMGPGGKMSSTETDRWMDGGFFLTIGATYDGVMGKGSETAFMGYDPEAKMYTYDAFSSMGEHESARGNVEGDTWTWISDENLGGQKLKGRYSMKILSPTSYAMKFEISPDGTSWNTVMEGKATKTK